MQWSLETSPSSHDASLLRIRDWIHAQIGVLYADDKLDVLHTRLRSVCLRYGVNNLALLANHLLDGPDGGWPQRIADLIVTNHTSFFREMSSYEYLRSHVFPKLSGRSIRIWSAACSTGEETYSIAMCARAHLSPTSSLYECRILGTDISATAVRVAEEASYLQGFDLLPREYHSQVELDAASASFRIAPNTKSLCTFRRINLSMGRFPFTQKFSVIFCRNVLYYFDTKTQSAILQRMYDCTEAGGWLFTSVTEPIRGLSVPWRMISPGIYCKDDGDR